MEAKPSTNQKERPMKKWQQHKPMEQEKGQQQRPRQPEQQREPSDVSEFGDVLALFQRKGCLTTKEELGTALRSLGYNPTDEELQEMLDEVSDGEDAIDISYFLELMNRRMKDEGSSGRLKAAFAMFDKDQNGFISVVELRNALKNMGQNLSEDDLNRMIRLADVDEDGQVDYPEFVNMMMSKN